MPVIYLFPNYFQSQAILLWPFSSRGAARLLPRARPRGGQRVDANFSETTRRTLGRFSLTRYPTASCSYMLMRAAVRNFSEQLYLFALLSLFATFCQANNYIRGELMRKICVYVYIGIYITNDYSLYTVRRRNESAAANELNRFRESARSVLGKWFTLNRLFPESEQMIG